MLAVAARQAHTLPAISIHSATHLAATRIPLRPCQTYLSWSDVRIRRESRRRRGRPGIRGAGVGHEINPLCHGKHDFRTAGTLCDRRSSGVVAHDALEIVGINSQAVAETTGGGRLAMRPWRLGDGRLIGCLQSTRAVSNNLCPRRKGLQGAVPNHSTSQFPDRYCRIVLAVHVQERRSRRLVLGVQLGWQTRSCTEPQSNACYVQSVCYAARVVFVQ